MEVPEEGGGVVGGHSLIELRTTRRTKAQTRG